jgi:hypothetical protein
MVKVSVTMDVRRKLHPPVQRHVDNEEVILSAVDPRDFMGATVYDKETKQEKPANLQDAVTYLMVNEFLAFGGYEIKLAIPERAGFLQATASSHLRYRLARLAGPAQTTHRAANLVLTSLFAAVISAGIFETIAHTACCYVLKR